MEQEIINEVKNEIKKANSIKQAFKIAFNIIQEKTCNLVNPVYINNSEYLGASDIDYYCSEVAELFKGRRVNSIIDIFIKITLAYSKKERFYHNLIHIITCFKFLSIHEQELIQVHNINKDTLNVIKLSLLFHDIVYTIGSNENELYSSILARSYLTEIGFDKDVVSIVENAILATWYSNPNRKPSNTIENLVVDLDLVGFGFSWFGYINNTKQVLKEFYPYQVGLNDKVESLISIYKLVPEEGLRKRHRFLSSLLDKNIFNTFVFIDNYEHIAKANIQKEITLIESSFEVSGINL